MRPFTEKEECREAVDALWKVLLPRHRGDSLSWVEVLQAIREPHYTNRGRHVVNRVRRRLLKERRIVTICVPTVGIKLLTHEQAAKIIPDMRQRKARRQVNRCLRETDAIDGSALSDHERKVLSQQRSNLRYQRLVIGRSRRELRATLKRSETNPIRRPRVEPEPATVG